jgi:hypothetical protein
MKNLGIISLVTVVAVALVLVAPSARAENGVIGAVYTMTNDAAGNAGTAAATIPVGWVLVTASGIKEAS